MGASGSAADGPIVVAALGAGHTQFWQKVAGPPRRWCGCCAGLRLSGNFNAHNIEGFARLAHEGFGPQVRRDGDRIVLKQVTDAISAAALRRPAMVSPQLVLQVWFASAPQGASSSGGWNA
jgi:hypothetical protein